MTEYSTEWYRLNIDTPEGEVEALGWRHDAAAWWTLDRMVEGISEVSPADINSAVRVFVEVIPESSNPIKKYRDGWVCGDSALTNVETGQIVIDSNLQRVADLRAIIARIHAETVPSINNDIETLTNARLVGHLDSLPTYAAKALARVLADAETRIEND